MTPTTPDTTARREVEPAGEATGPTDTPAGERRAEGSLSGRAHDLLAGQGLQWVLLGIALVAAVLVRRGLARMETPDFVVYYQPWIATLREGGFDALGTNFSNYNPPYLYALYVGTLGPFGSDLAILKAVATGFDLLLAAAVAAVVWQLRKDRLVAGFAAVAVLLLPEVLLNSGWWGQLDAGWTAFLVATAFFVLRGNGTGAWVMFGLAVSLKLQAAFLFPWIAVAFVVQRHRWTAPLWGVLAALLTYVPALVAGRSVADLAGIYPQQSRERVLAAYVVNFYSWLPTQWTEVLIPAGLAFGLGVVAALTALVLRRAQLGPVPQAWLLRVAAGFGVVVAFILPQMHDRYYYAGSVLVFLCAFVDRRYAAILLALQVTAFCAYAQYLFGGSPIPLQFAAVLQLVAVAATLWLVLRPLPAGPSALHVPRRAEPAVDAPTAP